MERTNGYSHCELCGQWHATLCPRIKATTYYPDGSLQKIEYHSPRAMQTIPEPQRESGEGSTGALEP